MGDSSEVPKDTVVVTGFGPFGTHTINASWVAVQELERLGIREDIRLIAVEIPVVYEDVKKIVPSLWEKYKPKLLIHVGVSGIAEDVTLEQLAHNHGYDRCDVNGTYPPNQCCVPGGPECLTTNLSMGKVCEAVNNSCTAKSVVSYDPGKYLCDFIFYSSLSISPSCTAFIHVPPLNKPYTSLQLAESIREAILNMLEQLTIKSAACQHQELMIA